MKKILITFLALTSTLILFSQEKQEEKKFGISFSGFVKSDFFFDTRQVTAAREGHFLFWPNAEALDVNNKDINAKANFNFLSVQTRLTGKITGPDALGAKTSALIEGDFFAQANDNINLFRLRHAYIKLNWTSTELLAGQCWNPLFVTDCFPGTVSFNTGTPLQSFARNPQLRITQKIGDFKILVAALSQRDYTTRGPDPADTNSIKVAVSSDYLRNSSIPDFHLQLQYENKSENSGSSILLGAGLAYKKIVPRLSTVVNGNMYKVDEKVNGLTIIAFTKVILKPVTIKLEARYGENIADVLSVSGFAVKEVTDSVTGESSYTPLKNITFWGEIHTNGKKLQVGIFGGYLKNLGAKESMSSTANAVYGFGNNIESLIRISPRVFYNINSVRLALELEYTSASFGDKNTFDLDYVPASTTTVTNLRTLLSVYYFF